MSYTINAEFQKALLTYLTPLLAPVEVYDSAPADVGNLYVTIGEDIFAPRDDKVRADKYIGTIQIDSWSLSQQSRGPLKTLMDQIAAAMNRQSFAITDYRVVLCRAVNQFTIREPDGVSFHGVQTFEVIIDSTT